MVGEQVTLAVEMIVDNSGSMQVTKRAVVKGINKFIEELATAIIPARLSVMPFDDVLRKPFIDGVSVANQPRVKPEEYEPNWGTENIAHCTILGLERLAKAPAHHKVLVVLTDGLNSSPQMAKAKKLVAERQKEGWLILWFGVYLDGYEKGYKPMLLKYAEGLGIPKAVTFAVPCSKIGKAIPFAARATMRFLGHKGDVEAAGFTAEERKAVA